MENVELVCIVCKKENRGSGVWSYHDSPSTWEQEDGLCPDCRQELFPEFGNGDRMVCQKQFQGWFISCVLCSTSSDSAPT